jgi:hypothetical protein
VPGKDTRGVVYALASSTAGSVPDSAPARGRLREGTWPPVHVREGAWFTLSRCKPAHRDTTWLTLSRTRRAGRASTVRVRKRVRAQGRASNDASPCSHARTHAHAYTQGNKSAILRTHVARHLRTCSPRAKRRPRLAACVHTRRTGAGEPYTGVECRK